MLKTIGKFSFFRLLSMLLGILSIPLLFRGLSSDQFNQWMSVMIIVNTVQGFDFGKGSVIRNTLAIGQGENNQINSLVTSYQWISIFLFSLIYWLFIDEFIEHKMAGIVLYILFIIFHGLKIMNSILYGIDKPIIVAKQAMYSRILFIILLVINLRYTLGYECILIAFFCTQLIFQIYFINKYGIFEFFKNTSIASYRELITRKEFYFFLAQLMIGIMNEMDTIFIVHFSDFSELTQNEYFLFRKVFFQIVIFLGFALAPLWREITIIDDKSSLIKSIKLQLIVVFVLAIVWFTAFNAIGFNFWARWNGIQFHSNTLLYNMQLFVALRLFIAVLMNFLTARSVVRTNLLGAGILLLSFSVPFLTKCNISYLANGFMLVWLILLTYECLNYVNKYKTENQ